MSAKSPPASAILYPPGGLLIWSLVLMELVTFGVALIAFMVSSRSEPELFHQSRLHLNPLYGAVNTVFLLVSGYFMAEAVRHFEHGRVGAQAIFNIAGIFKGLTFKENYWKVS